MNRRSFTVLTGAAMAALVLPAVNCTNKEQAYNPLIKEPELLSHIWDGETINEIGLLYRQKYSAEDSEQQLVKALTSNVSSDSAQVLTKLRDQIRQEYRSGDIIMLNGWILSRTEGRQCALFSLTLKV